MPVLTIVDTTGIQNYIFRSNRLRENIGASEIVAQATSDWVCEVLQDPQLGWATNLKPAGIALRNIFDQIDEGKELENHGLAAELIYAGGGNTLVLFDSPNHAKEFEYWYSRILLKRAPGLDVVVGHSGEFNMAALDEVNRPMIERASNQAGDQIDDLKANRPISAPVMGLGVTVECASTGGVAVDRPQTESDRKKYSANAYLSAETLAKLAHTRQANERLQRELLNDELRTLWSQLPVKADQEFNPFEKTAAGFRFTLNVPLDFDDLGRTSGDTSYIAVVHTDGNGVGERVRKFGQAAATSREWIKRARKFSRSIYRANLAALQQTIALLLSRIAKQKNDYMLLGTHGQEFTLSKYEDISCLPFRPLIFGGEDVAFVCDGRVGIALAAYYLKQAELQTLADEKPLFTRAGISIVKSHYPFSRSYKLAEDLAKSAKERIVKVDPRKTLCAIDWHIAATGLAGDVNEIRRREYTIRGENYLNIRPLTLHRASDTDGWRSWDVFARMIEHFLKPEWCERRNKIKALQSALREGNEATRDFITLYRLKGLPPVEGIAPETDGWHGSHCSYFDAIEAIDIFFPLETFTAGTRAQAVQSQEAQ